ncbi:uncharacterized protein LOC116016053 [Ipomoea triloba]|uniref:uncharacterized protein LOC116016053 n=1 Tax=Ipomoea triloba TaxID=35885 RepID=UPI00125E8AEF|nr:uncharacterized protein LOC116016053 [Ipomoea triloba]
MCWDACKVGFKYCRNLIGVDGFHIKDKAGGMMLTAIGIIGNESIFPIAYAIVEGENKESWCWFLGLLARDLEIDYGSQHLYTFMSDKQKGLEVRQSEMHYGRLLEPQLSHFSSTAKCDMLVNNICESFNAMILDARDSTLIHFLEIVRKHVICALWVKFGKAPLHDFVDDCYSIENYKKAYSGSIHPMAGPQEWPYTDSEPPLPPLFSKKVGRPRKMRKKSAGEITKDGIRFSRSAVTLYCSICKKIGHNSRRCPKRRAAQRAQGDIPVAQIPFQQPMKSRVTFQQPMKSRVTVQQPRIPFQQPRIPLQQPSQPKVVVQQSKVPFQQPNCQVWKKSH